MMHVWVFCSSVYLTYVARIQFTFFIQFFRNFFLLVHSKVSSSILCRRCYHGIIYISRFRVFFSLVPTKHTEYIYCSVNWSGNEGKNISKLDQVFEYSFTFPSHLICNTSTFVDWDPSKNLGLPKQRHI